MDSRYDSDFEVPELLAQRQRSQESPNAPSILRIAAATFAACCIATGAYGAASAVGGMRATSPNAVISLDEDINYHGIDPKQALIVGSQTAVDIVGIPPENDKEIDRSCASDQFHSAWPCCIGEEIFFNDCYRSCDNITNGQFPHRTDDCTCCKEMPCIKAEGQYVSDCSVMKTDIIGHSPHKPILTNCPYKNEELWEGLCYTKCSMLTRGQYPERTGINTCSNGKVGGNWTMGVGLCSGFGVGGTKCLPHIPQATGMGFEQAAGTKPGLAPLGFDAKFPKVVSQMMAGSAVAETS